MRTQGPPAVLLVASALAVVVASSPRAAAYQALVDFPGVRLPAGWTLSLVNLVDDGLMTAFFFLVTVEVKAEAARHSGRAGGVLLAPVLAAAAGMVMPAAVFLLVAGTHGPPGGWGIPMATDVTFAAAALGLVAPAAARLRIFLLTLAVADDVGAIVVIAVAYAHGVRWVWAVLAIVAVATAASTVRLWSRSRASFVVVALGLWCVLVCAGVNPTMAGVVMGALLPVSHRGRASIVGRVVNRRMLTAAVTWCILPLFAFMNAGVALTGSSLVRAAASPVFWGIVLGLFIGKPVGIALAGLLVTRSPSSPWHGLGRQNLWGMAQLGGIGFTVALFVNQLAFGDGPLGHIGRLGVFVGSVASALAGTAMLRLGRWRVVPPAPEIPPADGASPEDVDRRDDDSGASMNR
jgi:NhaA family Na+:H+ antiporter